MSTNSKSVHSLTRGTQVSAMMTTDVTPKSETQSERTTSQSAETVVVSNRMVVASRSSRQPLLSFSSFVPSSDSKTVVDEEAEEEEEEVKRTWNLRPRKACVGGGAFEVKNKKSSGGMEPKSKRQRGTPAESPGLGGVEVVNENHRLWVALSRDEIEEDLFSMSGNKPSRRPRKRTKTSQKYLDLLFPGLSLVGMNADCFKLSNSPPKR